MSEAHPATATEEWQFIGRHRVRDLEGIAFVECQGQISLEDAKQLTIFFEEVSGRAGCFLLLVDLRKSIAPGPEARKWLVDWTANRLGATACIGGSTGVNVVASLLNRAVRLIHGNSMPMEMFKIEAQALAWLRDQQECMKSAKLTKK